MAKQLSARLLLAALLVCSLAALVVRADGDAGEADVDEVHPDDRAAAEANPKSSFHGGITNTFEHDVLDKGVPKYVLPPSRDCKDAPDAKQCTTCCAVTGRSGRWVRDYNVKDSLKLKFKSCVCGHRTPRKE